MARIRSIKPEFPQSETIGRLSRDARLLFIQLWTIVDDEGRTRAASRMLASLLYPYDDDAPSLIEGWLSELETHACIFRYVSDGSHYLEIANWLKHQKIDKPSKSKIPSPNANSENPREDSRKVAPDLGPRIKDQEEDYIPSDASHLRGGARDAPSIDTDSDQPADDDRDHFGESPPDQAPPENPKPRARASPARACRLPSDLMLTDEHLAFATSEGISHDAARREFDSFRDYWAQASGERARKHDWFAAWRNWVRKAADRVGRSVGSQPVRGGQVDDGRLGAYRRAAARFEDQTSFS